ncbi:MAG: AI-2E family transporter [Candidatus Nealsonbacteria bacterium]|nr:AI-2E family transporter [Candidatus Nealsonbacteria bacterium]
MSDQSKILDISWETILKIAISGVIFYILYITRDILVWIIFALIISILFNPAIDFLKRFIPRGLAAIFVYVAIFGVVGISIYLIAPIFVDEINKFSQSFPTYFEKVSPILTGLGIEAFESFEKFTLAIESQLSSISSSIFSAVGAIFGGLFSTITILSMALFLSLEEQGIEKMIRILSPKRYEAVVLSILEKSQRKVSGWFGVKILGSLFIGLLTFLICYVLNIDYAVSFGLFAGILNFIPMIGSIIAGAVIAVIVAADAWLKAAFFTAAFILIQQIEGSILTPVLMKKFIGLPPVLVLIALLVGAKLWGMMGALLAIPMAGIFYEFLRDFLKKRKEEKAVVL